MVAKFLVHNNRDRKQRRRDGKENWKKAIVLYQQNNNSARASRLFCTFLSRRCTTAMWSFLISRTHFTKKANTTLKFSFSFSKLNTVLSDFTPENFPIIWQIKWKRGNSQFEWCFPAACCHPETLLPWQRDVTTSPLYTEETLEAVGMQILEGGKQNLSIQKLLILQ